MPDNANKPYPWDPYSDQPHILRDKAFKKTLYKKGAISSIKTFLLSASLPLFALRVLCSPRFQTQQPLNAIGLCVNPDFPLADKTQPSTANLRNLVDELAVDQLLIRIPLADIDQLQDYLDFIAAFDDKKILINILQDRVHIEDAELTRASLRRIFSACQSISSEFQIGNAVNRRKWGFISQDEYCHFFKVIQDLRDQEFPQIKLYGGNVIDFELPCFLRSLIHGFAIRFDACTTQLYVDRRGAPENTQMGCDTLAKIHWFSSILKSSRKTANKLIITEVNWPLEGTRPWAPAYGDCMVSETLQTTYLVRYYLLMMASGQVERCYWHQLVAPGYGLIDNLGTTLRKRDAFYSFKILIELFGNSQSVEFTEQDQCYRFTVKNAQGTVSAVWANNKRSQTVLAQGQHAIDLLAQPITPDNNGHIAVSDQVSYILDYPLSMNNPQA